MAKRPLSSDATPADPASHTLPEGRFAASVRALHERPGFAFLVVMAIAAGIILPWLGAAGFFDPWETNYAEVAREMGVRGDYLYPFWKDSYFFSKPVLLFWLTAPSYTLLGAGHVDGPEPALVELAGRLPPAAFGLLTVGTVYWAARRMWSTRTGVLSAIVLATTTLWAFLSRQAITDMLYVGPASMALLALAVALFDDDSDSREQRLPTWLVVVVGVCTVPQAIEIAHSGAFLTNVAWLGSEAFTRVGLGVVLVALCVALLAHLKLRARDPLLHVAALLFALSALAKGPPGVVVLGGVLLLTVLVLGEWRRLLRPAVLSSTVLFLAVAGPWYVVMALFAGVDDQKKTWFERFVLYDLLGRVGPGAHGDRGTFDYYLRYAGFGLFPWSALFPVALFSRMTSSKRGEAVDKAARFTLLVIVWAVAVLAFFSFTTTKFHHYILPLAVPSALLVGRYLDDVLRGEARVGPAVALFVVSGTALLARDLVLQPWQLVDLFTYHYESYKPEYYFPEDAEWRVGLSIACFGAAVLLALGALADALGWPRKGLDAVRTILGAPQSEHAAFVGMALVMAVLFAVYGVQVYLARVSQHWTQRSLVQTYFDNRQGDEPLIAYQMDWKGETFYGKNRDIQIKKSGTDLRNLCLKPGREFVLVQTDRYGGLKTSLGREFENKVRVIDRSSQKWYLVVVDDVPPPTAPLPVVVPSQGGEPGTAQ